MFDRGKRTALRGTAGIAALVTVLATAGSASPPAFDEEALRAQCLRQTREVVDAPPDASNVSVAFRCMRPDGTEVEPRLWLPAAPVPPAPVPALTAGRAACVTGPGRPVIDTVLTSVSATAAGDIVYAVQRLDGGDVLLSFGAPVREFGPGDLAPGESYRWRAQVRDAEEWPRDPLVYRDPEQGWSPWCEFTVSADAVDYRPLGDVSMEALHELGLRPDRTYAIDLSARQQRVLRDGTDVGDTAARMTLSGPRWTDLLVQLTVSASSAEEIADEPADGRRQAALYRALVDALSVALGGPRHPRFG